MMRYPQPLIRPLCSRSGIAAILLATNAFAAPALAGSRPSVASAAATTPAAATPASSAPGSVDARAARVLERYRAAIHASEPATSMHSKGRLSAFGFTGVIETWSERPDRAASATTLGPFTLKSGTDGANAWRTDPSGKLMVLDGRDLDRARASAWFENDRYLEADHGGATLTWIGTEKDSAGSYDVLEVAAPMGSPRRLYFDTATGLLAREVAKEDQQTLLSTPSDWRKVGQRLLPFRTRSVVVGMPANAIVFEAESVEVNVPIDRARFAKPEATAGTVHWLKKDGVARLPFEYIGRHVWLKASINGGPPADFLFDTGASITILDSAYAAKMGIATEGHMEAMGAGSSGGASFAKIAKLRVASDDGDGVELADQKIGVLSVNALLEPYFWRSCAGVLGYSFISQFVDEVDFDHRVLTLHDPKTFEYHGQGTKLPMMLAGTVPVVTMTLDHSIGGEYRLDVGSNSTVDVHAPFVRKHQLDRHRGTMIEATGTGFGGEFTNRLTRLQHIDLGPFGWDDPIVSLSGATSGALASEDYAGNIGNQILERFTCTFDYDHHAVYLEPGDRYKRRDRFSRAGVLLVRFADTVKAGQVLKDSPAAKAGIRMGDRVLEIEGKPILSYRIDDLEKLFEDGEEGRKIRFRILRDGREKDVAVKLREMI